MELAKKSDTGNVLFLQNQEVHHSHKKRPQMDPSSSRDVQFRCPEMCSFWSTYSCTYRLLSTQLFHFQFQFQCV